eukprot:Gb_07717 [translate_table: standard]
MAAGKGWRANADTHNMRPEDVEKFGVQASKRPPGQHPGNVLHQRGSLGISKLGTIPLAIAGCFVVAGIGASVLYLHSKPENNTTSQIAKSTVGVSHSR